MDARCREIRIIERLRDAVFLAIRRQKAALSATTGLADSLQSILDALLRAKSIGNGPIQSVVQAVQDSLKVPDATLDAKLQKLARRGIGTIVISWRKDEWATVCVDDYAVFSLPPKLAALLELLISVQEVDEDGFPAFMRYDTVRVALGIVSKRKPSHDRPVVQLVYRLRNAFEKADLNRYFVDSVPGRGVRILLRRAASDNSNGVGLPS